MGTQKKETGRQTNTRSCSHARSLLRALQSPPTRIRGAIPPHSHLTRTRPHIRFLRCGACVLCAERAVKAHGIKNKQQESSIKLSGAAFAGYTRPTGSSSGAGGGGGAGGQTLDDWNQVRWGGGGGGRKE